MAVRWNPWSDLFTLQEQMDQLLSQAGGLSSSQRGFVATLPVDIRQTDAAFIIQASIPGFQPEDVDLTLEDTVLTIQGTHRQEDESTEGGFVRRERRLGSVYRQINLPAEVRADEIGATFDNGVLTVTVPRAQRAQPRRIAVAGGAKAAAQVVEGSTPPA